MKRKKHANELRAGLFVLVGIIALTAAIFLLGRKSALFTRNTDLYASFEDISGLVVGAPVRLSGLEVGSVAAIAFPKQLADKRARVQLTVQSRFMDRIRADSEVFVESAGLLGDKVVNISMGSADAEPLSDGATLRAGQSVGLEALTSGVDRAVKSLVHITGRLEGIVADERTDRLQTDAARIAASLANILSEVEHGDGLLHRAIYDRRYGEQAGAILAETRELAEKANRAAGRVDAIVSEVERGDGTLHALVYGAEGKHALASLDSAAAEISDVVREVKEGRGVLHSLVYEQGQSNFLADLNEMSAVLKRVVQDVDKGRGTLGGLLRDPTVYEDLKTVLGNVKRNTLFKALVRFTMENEQLRRAEDAPRVSAPEQK